MESFTLEKSQRIRSGGLNAEESTMENNTQKETSPKKKSKTILSRLTTASQITGKVIKHTKTAIKITLVALTLGTAGYVYKQFHKSPEEIREETKVNMTKSKKAVEEAIQKDLGTNSVGKATAKAGGKIAEKGAAHGGAVRAWIAERFQKTE